MPNSTKMILSITIALAIASCGQREIISTSEAGIGMLVNRTACPAVATPVPTNEITIFNPRSSRDATAVDVTAVITNLRGACSDQGEMIQSVASFEVQARRRDANGARQVVIPYFATVLRGGNQIVSKEIGRIGLNFADGEYRATTTAQATASISRAAATLPREIEDRLTRRRRPGDPDSALDPMANPEVRTAVANVTFEVLVGFQLEPDQLEYNATR